MRRKVLVSMLVLSGALSGCGLAADYPDDAVFVANGGSEDITVVNPESRLVAGEITIGGGFHPHHLSISPDRTRLGVASPSADLSGGHAGHGGGSSKVMLVDTTTGGVALSLTIDATVHNVAFLDDFKTIVVAMAEHGMIAAYDIGSGAEVWTAQVGADPLEVTPSNGLLIVANSGDGTLSIVDPALKTVVDSSTVGDGIVAVWNTPLGLFASLETEKSVAILDAANLAEPPVKVDVGGIPGQVTGAGDEVWIAIEDKGIVEVRDKNLQNVVATVDTGGKPHGLAVVGDAVYVTDEGGSRVVVVDAATHEIREEIEVGDAPNGIVQVR